MQQIFKAELPLRAAIDTKVKKLGTFQFYCYLYVIDQGKRLWDQSYAVHLPHDTSMLKWPLVYPTGQEQQPEFSLGKRTSVMCVTAHL